MKYCFILIVLLWSNQLVAGTNYYVSTTGSNANNGLTTITAFKTITYAVNLCTHGDTVNVMAGTYTNATYGIKDIWKIEETVKINNKNTTSGNYLVIRPYNGALVKLKGDGDFIFQIRNSSYIRVQGFEIEGEVNNIPLDTAKKYQFVYRQCLNTNCTSYMDTFRVAFGTPDAVVDTMTFATLNNILRPVLFNTIGLLVQGSHHVDILGCEIHHNPGTGLRVFQGDYINLKRNNIHHNSGRSSVGNHGLVMHSSSSIDNSNAYKIFISENWVHHNYNEVYSWSELKTFITPHIDEGKGISMQKNTVGNGWLHGKIKIENNITDHNGFSGIHINEGIRIDVVNNTVFNNTTSFDGNGNNIGISLAGGDSIGFYNNIAVAPAGVGGNAYTVVQGTNVTAMNNLTFGDVNIDFAAIAVKTIAADPLFVDTIQFKLQSASPAIDTSYNTIAPTTDYYNTQRDIKPDRGAVEYVPNPLPVKLLSFGLKKISDKNIKIFWKTTAETNCDYFTVEKSPDAKAWTDLCTVKAKGTPDNTQEYETNDLSPLNGDNYYRLKQVETGGAFSYSNIIATNITNHELKVHPNPTSDILYVEGEDLKELFVISSDGKDVSKLLDITNAAHKTELSLKKLPSGIYYLLSGNKSIQILKENRK